MKFDAYGPFEIARKTKTSVARDKTVIRTFWDDIDAEHEGLSGACGCYVFVIRGRAWYVGLAKRQDFKHECFSAHKLLQYNDALQQVSGPPSLLLLAKTTPKGRFAKPGNGHPDVSFLETLLIGSALGRNPRLQNIKGTKLLKEMRVPGVLNTGQGQARSVVVQELKKALGI
jgi:hypothetical protein